MSDLDAIARKLDRRELLTVAERDEAVRVLHRVASARTVIARYPEDVAFMAGVLEFILTGVER